MPGKSAFEEMQHDGSQHVKYVKKENRTISLIDHQ